MIFAQAFRGIVRTVRLSILHAVLIVVVVIYLLIGGYAFHRIEGDNERKTIVETFVKKQAAVEKIRNATQEFVRFALYADASDTWALVQKLSLYLYDAFEAHGSFGVSAQEIMALDINIARKETAGGSDIPLADWGFGSSLLFAFTAITTIGAEKKEEEDDEDVGGAFLLVVFLIYILIGALICPIWEDWSFFHGIYFCFVTLTTIGFGDFYPKNLGYIVPTLLYITLGLALTTMTIEVAGTLFKKLHYLGAKLKNVRNAAVWFGGKKLTVVELAVAVGKKYGIPEEDLENLDFDAVVEEAIVEKEEGPKKGRDTMKLPEVEAEEHFEFRADSCQEIASIILPEHLFDEVCVNFCAAGDVHVETGGVFEVAADHKMAAITLPLPVYDMVELTTEVPKEPTPPPSPPPPKAAKPKMSVPENYKRSLSASLGLKLPSAAERSDLRLPKLSRTAAHHNEFPFYLVKTMNIQEAKLSDKCKHCLVAFPVSKKGSPINYVTFARKLASLVEPGRKFLMAGLWLRCASRTVAIALPSEISFRALTSAEGELSRSEALALRNLWKIPKGQRERGPRNIALVHWEKHDLHLPNAPSGKAPKKASRVSQEIARLSGASSPDENELRPTVIHPWYQCLINRYPYFSVDLMEIDSNLKADLDSKHCQLLVEQLGIDDTDEIKEASGDSWKNNPEIP